MIRRETTACRSYDSTLELLILMAARRRFDRCCVSYPAVLNARASGMAIRHELVRAMLSATQVGVGSCVSAVHRRTTRSGYRHEKRSQSSPIDACTMYCIR